MASELIVRNIYGDKYEITHNPEARGSSPRYKVQINGSAEKFTKPIGVTSVLGKVLAKDLTDWAINCCIDELTEKLPVITAEDLTAAAKAYTKKRDKGANTGSEAHALVERYLKSLENNDAVSATGTAEAMNAYRAFVKWFESINATVVGVEEVIYSETYGYAGCYDAMLEIDGKVYLTDLKTTNASRKAPNGVYAEYFLQLGAYAAAHEERRAIDTELPAIEGLMVISAKKNGKLDIVTNEDVGLSLDDCMNMWKRVYNLHEFLKYTTSALGGK